ncbi:MAG: tRNA modification GTPase [Flavobacteriaceae bacterium]|nr:tRNA modification GTPase [Flavobacteriaceae bacterium]
MKKQLLLLLTTILSLNCYSQISFEKGYYLDNDNQKINCLIKNIDWEYNPTEFKYKLSENSEPQKASIKSVKEFGIDNTSKYIRSTVNIDRSGDHTNNLSDTRKPLFKEEELFLEVLVDGKATLYKYTETTLRRYFYNNENSNIKQLVFKRFKVDESHIGENNAFRQQLWNDLKCSDFKMSKVENLDYRRKELVRFFEEYNTCNTPEDINIKEKEKKDLFNLTIRPRLNSSSLTIQSPYDYRDTDFGSKIGLNIGIEAEFILPFNKNKWAVIIEPTYYQNFNSEKTANVPNVSGGILIANVDYSSIKIPIGLRHYFFLNNNNNSKVFINFSYVVDIPLKNSIDFTRKDGSHLHSLETSAGRNFAMGIGYKQSDRYSLELRYQNQDILAKYYTWSSDYKTLSIIFGYSLF